MTIKILPGYDRPKEVGTLFAEYTEMLLKGDPSFGKYLEIQNYEEELKHLTSDTASSGLIPHSIQLYYVFIKIQGRFLEIFVQISFFFRYFYNCFRIALL